MYAFFVKLLKILLIAALVILGVLLVFGIVLSLGWPLWVGGFILAGLFGIVIGFFFLRKFWMRRREQRFVNEVVAQDEAYIQSLGEKDRKNFKELQARWKEAVEALRKSHLRKHGNPLYVLPWYMVVGESGSGKTTAIESARLSSPFAEISSTSGISGTKNCDWWFFDNAILIDTAGRYTVPVDESRDVGEWQKFLAHLKKFRKKETLNGLVVTVAADRLLENKPGALEKSAKLVRRRIDELMVVLGARFPVYILVTKCDLVKGMTHFCDQLEESLTRQAMGVLNRDFSESHAGFIRNAIGAVVERLKDLRLLLFQKPGTGRSAPGILMFPEEFEKMKSGLDAFISGAFQENPYQEKPILRGLFFSSGKQEGAPYSHLLKELGLIDEKEVLPGTSRGLFLHDFFSKILPGDRGLFAPTQRALEWSRLTRNLGITAWLAITIAFCGMLSFSFVQNLSSVREISREFQQPIVFQNDIMADAITMDRFLEAIVQVERKNSFFRIPRFGLTESRRVEKELKAIYCRKYHEGFLGSFDDQTSIDMARFSTASPSEIMGRHVSHLVRRIHLIQARMANKGATALYEGPQPVFTPLIARPGDPLAVPDLDRRLSRLYLHYILWQTDTSVLNNELNHLQKWLRHILTLPDVNLNWLVDWINMDSGIPPVRLSDFWGVDRFEETVPAAFTMKGKNRIDAFIPEIEGALQDPLVIAERKFDFYQWYDQAYLSVWHDFAEIFLKAPERLENRERWIRVASRIGSEQDPYFLLLDTMARHMDHCCDAGERPGWVDVVFNFRAAVHEAGAAESADVLKDSGIIKKATRQVQSSLARTERATGFQARSLLEPKNLVIAGEAIGSYRKSLDDIAPIVSSKRMAYQLAAEFYENDGASGGKAPAFVRGYEHADILKAAVRVPGRDVPVMERLIEAPVAFLHEFAMRDAACHLQDEWDRRVLFEVRDISRHNVNQLLMGENGFARKFIDGPAGPFIQRSMQRGYYPVTKKKQSLAFLQPFLSYLDRGETAAMTARETYTVGVRAEPTGANRGARAKPHQTVLKLHCREGATHLVNVNYPVSRDFSYSPQACSDVEVTVHIGNLVVKKTYAGYLAFPQFIRDFEKGRRRLHAGEFPEHQRALNRLDVEYITVAFDFKDHAPVLDFLSVASEPVPEIIGACWD